MISKKLDFVIDRQQEYSSHYFNILKTWGSMNLIKIIFKQLLDSESEAVQQSVLQFFEAVLNHFGYASTLLVFNEFKDCLEELYTLYMQLHKKNRSMSIIKVRTLIKIRKFCGYLKFMCYNSLFSNFSLHDHLQDKIIDLLAIV
jgi:hypothetical protein